MKLAPRPKLPSLAGTFEEGKEGLIIPSTVAEEQRGAERKVKAIPADTWRKWRRVFRDLIAEKIGLNLICGECKVLIRFEPLAPNKFALRCNCTDRTVTQGV